MAHIENNLDYQNPILIAPGVYWVGFHDKPSGLHCNPYVVTDGDEAVVIDGGSRPDFPTVMMKILQAGVDPSKVKALIYHHYDPDLCGSLPNYENMIDRDDLIILSAQENNMFIRHYSIKSKLVSLENMNHEYEFSSGREAVLYQNALLSLRGKFRYVRSEIGDAFYERSIGEFRSGLEPVSRIAARMPGMHRIFPLPQQTALLSHTGYIELP